jgi:hypothetical protein
MKTEKKAEQRAYARLIDYKRTFATVSGQRVLQDLMDTHGMLRSSFSPGDASQVAFKEGERNVILRIMAMLKMDPKKFLKHLEEIENDNRE